MSPSSVCDATEQPPAHTGINAQSPQLCQAVRCSNRSADDIRQLSERPSMCPVESVGSPVKPGQAYVAPLGPIVYACFLWISQGPMCTPSTVGNPRFLVSSRRCDISSSTNEQLSQMLEPPEPAAVMHVPFSGLSVTTINGMMFFATCRS